MEIQRLRPRPEGDLLSRPATVPTVSTVACTRCGRAFGTDPTLDVGCPVCGAACGERCRKPAQGGHHQSHLSRARIALGARVMSPCQALGWDTLHVFPTPVAPTRAAHAGGDFAIHQQST